MFLGGKTSDSNFLDMTTVPRPLPSFSLLACQNGILWHWYMSDTYNDNTEDKPSLHIIYSGLSWNTAPHTSHDTSCDLSTLFISFQWAFLAGLVLLKSAPYYSVCVRVCVRERIKKKKSHVYKYVSISLFFISSEEHQTSLQSTHLLPTLFALWIMRRKRKGGRN